MISCVVVRRGCMMLENAVIRCATNNKFVSHVIN